MYFVFSIRGFYWRLYGKLKPYGNHFNENHQFSGSTDLKEGQIIEHWAEADPEYQISKGKYSLAAKISMDEAALKFGEDHPDIRIVIFNPSMIVGMDSHKMSITAIFGHKY